MGYGESTESPESSQSMASAGLFSKKGNKASRRGIFSRSRASKKSETKRKRLFEFSASAAASSKDEPKELTVAKSSISYPRIKLGQKRPRWKFLTPEIRKQIDAANISKGRWRYIVIHNSATERGNARAFERYHRDVKRMKYGMAYHFVVGNGSYSGDGEVEVGSRWKKQIHGGHMKSMNQNRMAIGICLVGDFNSDRVRDDQLEALDELVTYLQAKCGKAVVTTHRQINVVPTTCPGKYFPDRKVMSAYNE